MDDEAHQAHQALAHFVQSTLAEQFDRIAAEREELRHRLQLVEQRTGLALRKPRGAHRRKLAVIELR